MGIYIFTIDKPYEYKSQIIQNITFKNDWLFIKNGLIRISEGYSWDGCSPKVLFSRKWYFGVPDGPIMADGYPQTAWASLVHDSLCQFKREVPIKKKETVILFDNMLKEAKWPLRSVYTAAINLFGPQVFAGDTVSNVDK